MNEWKLREQMCEIGRRVYNKGFAAANDGNISYRLAEDRVLCTPTRVSKGFMKPDDLCIVDLDGKQVSGKRKRSSEILLHLTHHEGAAGRPLGRALPSAPCHGLRRRPGADPQVRAARDRGLPGRGRDHAVRDARRRRLRRTVLPYVKDTDTILLANHGTVTYGTDLEDAYFKTEIIDAYCRILILAKQLGRVNYYSDEKAAELIRLKPKLGIPDPRLERGLENCDLCGNSLFREGYGESRPRAAASSSIPRLADSYRSVLDRVGSDAARRRHQAGRKAARGTRPRSSRPAPTPSRRATARPANPVGSTPKPWSGDHRPGHAGPERRGQVNPSG